MSDTERLEKLEKDVAQLKLNEEERLKKRKEREKSRRIWIVISTVLILAAAVIPFFVSCDMTPLFAGFPPICEDKPIEDEKPYEEKNPQSEIYTLVSMLDDSIFSFTPEYARIEKDGSILIYGDNGSATIENNAMNLADGTDVKFFVTSETLEGRIGDMIILSFSR